MPISQEELKKIGERLDEKIRKVKGEDLVCPACKNTNFQLIDAYTHRNLNDKVNETNLGKRIVPSITAICNNCGYILDFAVGILGLLETEEVKKNEKK